MKSNLKRDLLFGALFLLIFISTCVSVRDWQKAAENPSVATPASESPMDQP